MLNTVRLQLIQIIHSVRCVFFWGGGGEGTRQLPLHHVRHQAVTISNFGFASHTTRRLETVMGQNFTVKSINQTHSNKQTQCFGHCFGSGFRGPLDPDSESGSRGLKKVKNVK